MALQSRRSPQRKNVRTIRVARGDQLYDRLLRTEMSQESRGTRPVNGNHLSDIPSARSRSPVESFAGLLPDALLIRGSIAIPEGLRLGLVCSVRVKGSIVIETYDYAKSLRSNLGVVIGGFQSPMERQVLNMLLARRVPVIVVPARNPERMNIPREWRNPMEEGWLTVVSGVGGATRRVTRTLALRRNLLVAAMADRILIPFATPGGGAEAVARIVTGWGKPLMTFDDGDNAALLALGAERIAGREAHHYR